MPPILFVQDGWVITANTALGYIAKWHEDKLSPVYYFEPTNNYNIMGVCVAESLLIVHEGRWDEGNPHRTQVSVFNLSMITDGFNDHHDRGSAQAARRLSPTNPRPFVLPKGLEELARKSPATYCIEGNGDECSTLTFIVKTPFGLCNTRSAETWRYQPFRYGIQVHKGPVPGEESFKYIPHTDMEFMESDLRQKLKNCVITLSSSGRRALWFDKNRDTRIQSDNQGSPESKSGRVYFGSGGDSSTIRADWQSPVFFDDTLGMLVLPDTPEYVSVHWFLPRDLLVSKEVGKKPTHH